MVGFGTLAGIAGLALRGIDRLGPWLADGWILLFAGLGAAIGALLTLVEVFLIQALCILCLLGFVLDLGVLGGALGLRRVES